ncbi:MAG: NapC/NirT family cytochrome c [Sulfuricella sp.]|nr:NapC/NirT family cytochrome c [Sulfuricella sp.]
MSNPNEEKKSGGFWRALRSPSARYSLLTLLGGGFIAGIIFWGGFSTAMDATNKLEFCISCHEMKDTVYQEYKKTVHYSNRTGVRAVCADCHVPKEFGHKMLRKLQASQEVWGKITGVIDTPEKFEAHRKELAEHERARMRAAGSRECRNCHNYDGMDPEKQDKLAQKKHVAAAKPDSGKSCIDCHQGIAHKLPKGEGEDD